MAVIPAFLVQRLVDSRDAFVWAAMQIPQGRCFVLPLPEFGPWPVARIVYHLAWTESHIALPLFYGKAWDRSDEEAAWQRNNQSMDALITSFEEERGRIISALNGVSAWNVPIETPWGALPPVWLAMRIYQQTISYTDTLLQMSLYWDLSLQDEKNARLDSGRRKDINDGWQPPQNEQGETTTKPAVGGNILSINSRNSILSVGSENSILSFNSRTSVISAFSRRSVGAFMSRSSLFSAFSLYSMFSVFSLGSAFSAVSVLGIATTFGFLKWDNGAD